MTKEQILEATLELATEKGLGRISMSQIAERVGLRKSSLYSHFKSKDEIIESMYVYFRDKAKASAGGGDVDYGKLVEGHSLEEILNFVVNSYRQINLNSDMMKFYKLIESERTVDRNAAMIMVEETNRMIQATKILFYAIQAKGVADFGDPDGAALSFAMGVHAVILFECDGLMAEVTDAQGQMDRYIREFCRVYGG